MKSQLDGLSAEILAHQSKECMPRFCPRSERRIRVCRTPQRMQRQRQDSRAHKQLVHWGDFGVSENVPWAASVKIKSSKPAWSRPAGTACSQYRQRCCTSPHRTTSTAVDSHSCTFVPSERQTQPKFALTLRQRRSSAAKWSARPRADALCRHTASVTPRMSDCKGLCENSTNDAGGWVGNLSKHALTRSVQARELAAAHARVGTARC